MKKFLVFILIFLIFPLGFSIAREEGDVEHFFVEESYDYEERRELGGKLILITEEIYFYADKAWWVTLSEREENEYTEKIGKLGEEFSERIYEKMISNFGDIPTHPASENERMSVLIHPMRDNAGGYFNSGDQYSRYQNPRSNEENILYLNSIVLDYQDAGGFLAHEFMHLLVFNQKERLRGVREEVWLNEARAEFMPTFLGYDDHDNSNLDKRIETFLRDPDISLTEWIGGKGDYGVVNVFIQYLVDHYEIDILIDSLKSEKVGIESINYALKKSGHDKNFNQVFDNFKIAVLVNDCSLGERLCFKSDSFQDLKVSPAKNYIPYSQDGSLSVQYRTKNWAGNWHKITGGSGTINFEFRTEKDLKVSVPYLVCNYDNDCEIDFIKVDNGRGSLEVEGFNSQYKYLTVMPSIQNKTEGFNGAEKSHLFSWEVKITEQNEDLKTLEKLKILRNVLQILRERAVERESRPDTCTIKGPIRYGSSDSDSVICLQLFLSTKLDIYPEGYVTGNFLSLTQKAVIRFQEKYAEDVLHPLGLERGTGYVGPRTISKINNIR